MWLINYIKKYSEFQFEKLMSVSREWKLMSVLREWKLMSVPREWIHAGH